jgi:hypothetical protein
MNRKHVNDTNLLGETGSQPPKLVFRSSQALDPERRARSEPLCI